MAKAKVCKAAAAAAIEEKKKRARASRLPKPKICGGSSRHTEYSINQASCFAESQQVSNYDMVISYYYQISLKQLLAHLLSA
jgi:hypothetical protein